MRWLMKLLSRFGLAPPKADARNDPAATNDPELEDTKRRLADAADRMAQIMGMEADVVTRRRPDDK